MRTIISLAILLLLAGCINDPRIDREGIYGGGLSDQDVVRIQGKGSVSQLPYEDEDGNEIPGWTAVCTDDGCEILWATQNASAANAQVEQTKAIGQIVIDGVAAGIGAMTPLP